MGNMNYFGKTFKGSLWGSNTQSSSNGIKSDGKGGKNEDKNKSKP